MYVGLGSASSAALVARMPVCYGQHFAEYWEDSQPNRWHRELDVDYRALSEDDRSAVDAHVDEAMPFCDYSTREMWLYVAIGATVGFGLGALLV